jgi:hypothetical protein
MIASVGNAVLTWKAGSIGKNVGGGVRGRIPIDGSIHRKKKGHGGKWLRKFVTLRHFISLAHFYRTSRTEARYRRLATLVGAVEETKKSS